MTILKKVNPAIETALLKSLAERTNYEQYIHYIDAKRTLPTTQILLHDYKMYYELYKDVDVIDWGEFYTQFGQNWHKNDLEEQDVEYYRDYVFPAIENCARDEIEKCLLGLIEKQAAEKIAENLDAGLDITQIRDTLDWLEQRHASINKQLDQDVCLITNTDFEILDKNTGIPWFMPSLQKSVLSITAGQFIIVSADYGTGKSAFVISQLVHTLKWLNKNKDPRPILYFNSEGTSADVFARMLSCLYKEHVLGGFEEIVERHAEVVEKFTKVFNPEQCVVMQMSSVSTFNAVKAKIKKYKPCLAIIDICDKLAAEEDVQNLKKLYDNLRVLSSAECPIIGTTQSGNTSYFDKKDNETKQKKWLGDHDLYGSKSGKGGAADLIITIGKDEGNSPLRYIATPKKKRGEPVKITCELINKYSYYKELDY